MARILVVDDQLALAELIQTVLEEDSHSVEAVHGGKAALEERRRGRGGGSVMRIALSWGSWPLQASLIDAGAWLTSG